MVVHSPHKRAVIAEDTLDFGGMGKLKFLVNVARVVDWPPAIDALVDSCAIRPEL